MSCGQAVHGCGIPAVPEAERLEREGWTRRFLVSPTQVADQATVYQALGFEVRAVPVDVERLPEGCAGCAPALASYRYLYTKDTR